MRIYRQFSSYNDDYSYPIEGRGIRLSAVDSHRGLGRSFMLGGIKGAYAAKAGKEAADKADAEGKTDEEIVKDAAKAGRRRGFKIGAILTGIKTGLGALGGYLLAKQKEKETGKYDPSLVKKGAFGGALSGIKDTAWTSSAGYYGAKKNAQERVNKRAKLERSFYY